MTVADILHGLIVPYRALHREQERIQREDMARQETERILAEQQAVVDAKKAQMVKQEAEKEKVRHTVFGKRCR